MLHPTANICSCNHLYQLLFLLQTSCETLSSHVNALMLLLHHQYISTSPNPLIKFPNERLILPSPQELLSFQDEERLQELVHR